MQYYHNYVSANTCTYNIFSVHFETPLPSLQAFTNLLERPFRVKFWNYIKKKYVGFPVTSKFYATSG